ncbi:hypothetical protein Tco_0271003 [Tanacetum coccineum]
MKMRRRVGRMEYLIRKYRIKVEKNMRIESIDLKVGFSTNAGSFSWPKKECHCTEKSVVTVSSGLREGGPISHGGPQESHEVDFVDQCFFLVAVS